MKGYSASLRQTARTVVRGIKRGGALSERELGNIMVGQHLSSWLEGYEQAVEDFFQTDDWPDNRGRRWHGNNSSNRRRLFG